MPERIPTSFRLSDEAKALLRTLSKEMGISKSAVLELAIRLMAGGVKELRRDVTERMQNDVGTDTQD